MKKVNKKHRGVGYLDMVGWEWIKLTIITNNYQILSNQSWIIYNFVSKK